MRKILRVIPKGFVPGAGTGSTHGAGEIMRILVGVGNEESTAASSAYLKAAAPGTEVLAAAVVPKPNRLAGLLETSRPSWSQHLQEIQELEHAHATELLATFVSNLGQSGLTIETCVLAGDPAAELIRLAKRRSVDLLMVTRQPMAARPEKPAGQVPQRLARYAKCSTLLLNPAVPVPQTYMLATDGSPQSQKAADSLAGLPINGNPALLVCTVSADFNPAFVKSGSLDFAQYQRLITNIRQEEIETARRIVDQACAPFEDSPFNLRKLAYTGDTAEVLLRVIREFGVDLLALGAKGMSTAAEFWLGSVTLKVVNHSSCSILVAR